MKGKKDAASGEVEAGLNALVALQAETASIPIVFVHPDLVPDAHGDAPVRHGAIRFCLGDRSKFLQRLPVPERVQRRERGIEARLNVGTARDGKADVASAALHQIVSVGLGTRAARSAERKQGAAEMSMNSSSSPALLLAARGERIRKRRPSGATIARARN